MSAFEARMGTVPLAPPLTVIVIHVRKFSVVYDQKG
jgi:hypothetical protein